MPPKVKITKQQIVDAALQIVRQSGADGINARSIANALSCSTQPVFSNFETMEDLRYAVVEVAESMYEEYTDLEIRSGKYPIYKATGMAYIRFAKDEPELFKLLFMRDRTKEVIPALSRTISDIVQSTTGLKEKSAELFHLEIWAFVHGIAAMLATNYLKLDTNLISDMVTDVYQGLKSRYQAKEQ